MGSQGESGLSHEAWALPRPTVAQVAPMAPSIYTPSWGLSPFQHAPEFPSRE